MIIELDDCSRIVGTKNCWELQRTRMRQGEKSWEAVKWFTSFRRAVEDSVHREIRLHPATSLSEAIEAVSVVVRKYEELIPSENQLIANPTRNDVP